MDMHEIDKHVEHHLSVAEVKKLNLCAVYVGAKPVIKFVRGLLFFKPKWQQIIDLLTASLDESCNTNP